MPIANFTATLPIANQPLRFVFSEVICPGPPKYFVAVYNKAGQFTTFEMKFESGKWHLVEPVAEAIRAKESLLVEVIGRYASDPTGATDP